MKYLPLVLALVLAACSNDDNDEPASATAHIAILGTDGNVTTFNPATDETVALTTDGGTGRLYSQPTWSPDGTRLALVATTTAVGTPGVQADPRTARVEFGAQATSETFIYLVSAQGGEATVAEAPFAPYYLYWSPDGTKLTFLGVDPTTQLQTLGIMDTGTLEVDTIDTGQPYYFAWSPTSERLLVHAGDRDLYYLGLDGDRVAIGSSPGGFTAPGWRGDTQLIAVDGPDGSILGLFETDGRRRRTVTSYGDGMVLGLSPDQARVAYIDVKPGANLFGLGALNVKSPQSTIEVADPAGPFFWSADGTRLLYLTPDVDGDDFRLRWNVWADGESVGFEPFLPTRTFVQRYLPFFGQYANSHAFFSPDGSAFTFTGTIIGRGEGVWLQTVEGSEPARLIGSGEVATWAP
jgi:TolB protein